GGPPAETRRSHTAVWTGSRMIVWGGVVSNTAQNTGGVYDPGMDIWMSTSVTGLVPTARADHTAVWTGTRMIVWGGSGSGVTQNTGGVYDPGSNAWTAATSTVNAPSVRM